MKKKITAEEKKSRILMEPQSIEKNLSIEVFNAYDR